MGVPSRQHHRTDSNNRISFEAESWRNERGDVNIKKTFIPACVTSGVKPPAGDLACGVGNVMSALAGVMNAVTSNLQSSL